MSKLTRVSKSTVKEAFLKRSPYPSPSRWIFVSLHSRRTIPMVQLLLYRREEETAGVGSSLPHEALPRCVSTQLVQFTGRNHHLPWVWLPRGVSECRDCSPLNSRRRGPGMARNPSLETVTGDHNSINATAELQLSGARSKQLTTRPQCSGGEADNGRHMSGTRLHTAWATQESGGSYPPSPVLGWRGWGECQHQD